MGKGSRAPMLSLEALQTLSLGFYGGLITEAGGMKSLATGNWFNLQPFCQAMVGGGTENWFPLAPSPHPQVIPKGYLINMNLGVVEKDLLWITRHFFHLYGSGFRNQWQKNKQKTKGSNWGFLHSQCLKFPFGFIFSSAWRMSFKAGLLASSSLHFSSSDNFFIPLPTWEAFHWV